MNKLIVGLGNPGKKYKDTRHNVGFQVVDFLAQESGVDHFTSSSHAEAVTAETMMGGEKTLIVKPETFMNESGRAVQSLVNYFDTAPENVLIIHDDIDLPISDMRMSFASSAGGHNGVQSVIDELGTNEFPRLRIGIRPDPASSRLSGTTQGKEAESGGEPQKRPSDFEKMDTRDFVLQEFSKEEKEVIDNDVKPQIKEAVEVWVQDGRQATMNTINR